MRHKNKKEEKTGAPSKKKESRLLIFKVGQRECQVRRDQTPLDRKKKKKPSPPNGGNSGDKENFSDKRRSTKRKEGKKKFPAVG